MTLGAKLKELRARKGVSLAALEDATGVAASSLAYYENDKKNPSIDRLRRVAEYYGVSLDYLAGIHEVESADLSTQEICRETGLSEEAVSVLRKYAQAQSGKGPLIPPRLTAEGEREMAEGFESSMRIFSDFICHDEFGRWLLYSRQYVRHSEIMEGLRKLYPDLLGKSHVAKLKKQGLCLEDFQASAALDTAIRTFARIADALKAVEDEKGGTENGHD